MCRGRQMNEYEKSPQSTELETLRFSVCCGRTAQHQDGPYVAIIRLPRLSTNPARSVPWAPREISAMPSGECGHQSREPQHVCLPMIMYASRLFVQRHDVKQSRQARKRGKKAGLLNVGKTKKAKAPRRVVARLQALGWSPSGGPVRIARWRRSSGPRKQRPVTSESVGGTGG